MSKFKSENGIQLTQGLFYEFNNQDAPFTLRMDDHKARSGKEYTSMYKLFMESVDEYDAATKILGSYSHWQKLCNLDWFMNGHYLNEKNKLEGLKTWREHMRARDESNAKRQLLMEAENGSVTAQKTIYDVSRGKDTPKKKKPVQKDTGASTKVSDLTARFQELKK